jgi:UDP-4-amino-4,6-dideoxy-N-acetyl-beta-L-altrosamine transaminase
MIPYGRQEISQADIDAVVEVLRSDWLTQGPAVPRFEAAVAESCGAAHAVAVNSATSALHIACLALGLGPGDRLWTSPVTFVASANCGRYCGAEVDFVDIDPVTCNLSVGALQAKLEQAARDGSLPKIVVPVHFGGLSCDMAAIHELSQRYGFRIIEDASHAIGGRYRDQPVGAGLYSDVTVFSFHPVKIITTGEGGMALTPHADIAERMRNLRSHGIVRSPASQAGQGAWYYEQTELGFNYRLTDIQAALGLSQLQRMQQFVQARSRIAESYDALLSDLPLTRPGRLAGAASAWHLYVIRLRDAASRRRVFDGLKDAGIGVNVHYIPVYHHPDYRRLGFAAGYCPNAEDYYARAVTLPLYPALTDHQQQFVVSRLRELLS